MKNAGLHRQNLDNKSTKYTYFVIEVLCPWFLSFLTLWFRVSAFGLGYFTAGVWHLCTEYVYTYYPSDVCE
ncbi:hypothetical protein XENTR_v10011811 [Xenopus tropicalis]|nr:hypothetical protein XENTR_v10011811 [Xenopus tropicalis]